MRALEEMNLGERQSLTAGEKRMMSCLNASGEVVKDLFADPLGSRTMMLSSRAVVSVRRGQEIVDPGSELGGWKKKCFMRAVLSCVSGDAWDFMYGAFLERCNNNSGAGLCGSSVEASNFNVVRTALRKCSMCVRVWGASSLRSFSMGEVSSCGLLGARWSCSVGDLVWCEEEGHVYVCRNLGDLEKNVHMPNVPWNLSVVGGDDCDCDVNLVRNEAMDEGVAEDVRASVSLDVCAVELCALSGSLGRVELPARDPVRSWA
jgi:hypothetical protein